MNDEFYEPSLEPEILEKVRKQRFSHEIAGVSSDNSSRLKEISLFDLERVNNLIKGSWDIHIHPGPDPFVTRIGDQIELAIDAYKSGMEGILFKSHHVSTAATVPLVKKALSLLIPEYKRESFKVYGGIVLNEWVGGINPEAVLVSARIGGKVVWPPTVDSSHYRKLLGESKGIDVLDNKGKVVPEMKEVLNIIAKGDLVFNMSCLSVREIFTLIEEATQLGVKRMNIVHPNHYSTLMTVEQMREASEIGVYIELTCGRFQPSICFSWDTFMKAYENIGPDKIIAASDNGIYDSFPPITAFRHFITGMLTRGIPDTDVETMIKTNPKKLLEGSGLGKF